MFSTSFILTAILNTLTLMSFVSLERNISKDDSSTALQLPLHLCRLLSWIDIN